MDHPATAPLPRTPDEIAQVSRAERYGDPFLVFRDKAAKLQLLSLPGSWDVLNVGRSRSAELSLSWDREVSSAHAQLERVADHWALVDDGLSRNGSYVNGDLLVGRRRLSDGDCLRFGSTEVLFRHPLQMTEGTWISGDIQ